MPALTPFLEFALILVVPGALLILLVAGHSKLRLTACQPFE
jgi:hypothetical protein